MKVLVIDNYDSFVYNLVYLLKEIGAEVDVFRNDKIALEEVKAYDHILLSPGPGIPSEAGIMLDLLKEYASTKRILGVCLGHQAIAESFGSKLQNMGEVLHGVTTECVVTDPTERLFQGIPARFEVCRYHSWTVIPDSMPTDLKITAVDDKGYVMAEAHQTYDVRGVQFHPEAYLTQHGLQMIKNWIQ
ncbi:aminodeoxychorismate/anthranilate synthase component II [Aquirufa nivalisilvae]|jgi:anthranilate synthase component 2|uniref:Aminodeoxychorismate synthase n=1 Tax=Aquirufa nivalisilvae TaxID=2516557 RepID=A0A2S2DS65_9BACT|nr:aminodeoxychorismate/anthranilate synthase component II [Aquirufa nivalisilvae]AWL08233.1 Aminodeoxychorismate synthase [Aquirufa nivalisilvae]MCZ2478702.1 aminodeoxychorismate/anthranilate synthase component II [Aquirufa nivalisilvae]MCZ2483441.1 aminodeoxychorismate/anthranilate synthase component II [Aquirufa nivalisilvae]TBH75642.1 aminodeoxychorismate/anthranilate synthase component II [Aquirufa nivalisilvae]